MIVTLVILFGFLYGLNYFKFCELYGVRNNSPPLGIYILSLKWWNIKFNWYTTNNKVRIDASITFPKDIKNKQFREYIIAISSTGIITCAVNIDKRTVKGRKR